MIKPWQQLRGGQEQSHENDGQAPADSPPGHTPIAEPPAAIERVRSDERGGLQHGDRLPDQRLQSEKNRRQSGVSEIRPPDASTSEKKDRRNPADSEEEWQRRQEREQRTAGG